MIKINLLAPGLIKKEERYELLIIAYVILAVLAAIGTGKLLLQYNQYYKLEKKIDVTQRQLAIYQSIVQKVDAMHSTKSVLEMQKNLINTLMQRRLIYPQFMEILVRLMPANIWFTGMTTQLLSDGTMRVTLTAESTDNYAIADFISALSSDNNFFNVELGSISSGGTEAIPSSPFRVTFCYGKKI